MFSPRIVSLAPAITASCARALAIGNFDGVHLGHRKLLEATGKLAQAFSLSPGVLSFHPHPQAVFAKKRPVNPALTSPVPILSQREKCARLRDAGMSLLILQRFSLDFAQMDEVTFVRDYLLQQLRVQAICVGENFRFGHQRKGNTETLRALAKQYGFALHIVPMAHDQGLAVSSGRVRQALMAGDLLQANHWLAKPYSVSGRVQHGRKLGRTLDMPTLNIPLPTNDRGTAVVNGIYVASVLGIAHRALPAVISIGTRPTVSEQGKVLLEAHLIDYRGDCYGKLVRVVLHQKLRDEIRFDSIDALKAQMHADLNLAKDWHQKNEATINLG